MSEAPTGTCTAEGVANGLQIRDGDLEQPEMAAPLLVDHHLIVIAVHAPTRTTIVPVCSVARGKS